MPQILPGNNQDSQVRLTASEDSLVGGPAVKTPRSGSVDILLVPGSDSPASSTCTVPWSDPLTVQILPDRDEMPSDSPIVNTIDRYENVLSPSDWGVQLSTATPTPREDSILPTVPTPPTNNSPFWESSPYMSPFPLRVVTANYSQSRTPSSGHGPTPFFVNQLRQRVLQSRERRRNDDPSNARPQFSPQIQRLIVAEVSGIARLNNSNNGD